MGEGGVKKRWHSGDRQPALDQNIKMFVSRIQLA